MDVKGGDKNVTFLNAHSTILIFFSDKNIKNFEVYSAAPEVFSERFLQITDLKIGRPFGVFFAISFQWKLDPES